jgi:hypothetical protein
VGHPLWHVDGRQRDLLDDKAEHGLAIGLVRRRRAPHGRQIPGEGADLRAIVVGELDAVLLLRPRIRLLDLGQLAQTLLPLTLERARDNAVVGVDGLIPPLSVLRFIRRLLHARSPLSLERCGLLVYLPLDGEAQLELLGHDGLEQQ